jgi:hypothetical protein
VLGIPVRNAHFIPTGVPNNRHSFPRKHVREVDKVPSSRCLCGPDRNPFPTTVCMSVEMIYN